MISANRLNSLSASQDRDADHYVRAPISESVCLSTLKRSIVVIRRLIATEQQ